MKRKHTTLIVIASLAGMLATGATLATGEQHIHSHKGTCQVTVPSDWKQNSMLKSMASAPGKAVTVVVTSSEGFTALADVKPIIQSSLVPVKTIEDTSQRLWYQYKGDGKGIGWYVGVPGKGVICGAQISFKNAAQADLARKIALSVRPAP